MMSEREEERSGTHAGTVTGTKERNAYRALLHDTILLLKEDGRTTLRLSKHTFSRKILPKTSFAPAPSPSLKRTVKSLPPFSVTETVPVPDPSPSSPLTTHHSSLITSSPSSSLPRPSSAPVPDPSPSSFNLSSLFPEMHHIATAPDDSRAKENATRWKKWKIIAPVIILSFGEEEEELTYLKNLAKAIHTRLKGTKILDGHALEKEKRWETLFRVNVFELILVTQKGLGKTELLKALVEEPNFAAKTPLFILTPAIMQDKAALWKKICHQLTR